MSRMDEESFYKPAEVDDVKARGKATLGRRIRERRKAQGLTLTDVSKRTGLTVSFLSSVERGQSGISISSLRVVAEALEVPIFHFLASEDDSTNLVVRRDRRKTLYLPESRLRYELLVPDLNRSLEFWIGYLEPGASSSDQPLSHPAEECILVLEGVMEIEVGGQTYLLYPGDSITYDGRIPHRAVNRGAEELAFVSAVTPPVF